MIDQKRLIKYWFTIFAVQLFMLLFACWSVYAFRRLAPEPPSNYVSNDNFFYFTFLLGLIAFGISFFLKKTFKGFVASFLFCLLTSLLGLITLFIINSFYFLLWFIIGFLGTGIHLIRYQNSLEKLK